MSKTMTMCAALAACSLMADEPHVTISDRPTPVSTDPGHWWTKAAEYRDAEAEKLRDCDVVWLGDSIVHYFEQQGPKAELWKRHFAGKPYLGLNFGIEGDATENLLWRMKKSLAKTCPKVIVLNIGTNNAGKRSAKAETSADTLKGLAKVIAELRDGQPQAKVLVYALFPRGKGVTDPCQIRNEKVNEGLAKLCDERQFVFCDIRAKFLKPDGTVDETLLEDRLHPAPKGYETWIADVLPRIEKAMAAFASEKDAQRTYWERYALRAYRTFRPDEMRRGLGEIAKLGFGPSEELRTRVVPTVKMFDDYDRFPKAEADIRFPASLADLGVADAKGVDANDFAGGWNPTNATAALQAAVDSGATTVHVYPKPGPWYVDSVALRSNLRLVVHRGAKVLMDKSSPKKDKDYLFVLRDCKNVIVEGEGTGPDGSYVGGYASYEERKRFCKNYGKSVFFLDHAENVVFRNLRIAESAEDGIFFGGLGLPSVDTYVDNVVIDSHFRQAMSICNGDGVYCRKVAFLNTRGNAPSAGIDFEPPGEQLPNAGVYLYDCTFENNAGGALMFATSTYAPLTVHAKRTRFGRHPAPLLHFMPRLGLYLGVKRKAPVKMIFEGCDFETYADLPAVEILGAPLFDFALKDCVIRQTPEKCDRQRKYTAAPIRFSLNRDFGPDGLASATVGTGTFENVRCEGCPEGTPAVEVADEIGLTDLKGVLKGAVTMNGKSVDLTSYAYNAPDRNVPKHKPIALKMIVGCGERGYAARRPLELSHDGAWWLPVPLYSYVFNAKKGDAVSMTVALPAGCLGENLMLESAVGGKRQVAALRPGANAVSFAVPADGWYRLTPPAGATVGDMKGAAFAYQSDTANDGAFKFRPAEKGGEAVGYFEVPSGGQPCRIRMTCGTLELRDPAGNVVERVRQGEYLGRHVFTVAPSSDKAEIWSFRAPAKSGVAALKFYPPLNGVVAESPETLPCLFAEHAVPAKRPPVAKPDPSWGDRLGDVDASKPLVDRAKLSPEDAKALDAAIAERVKLAADKVWTKRLAEETQLLENLKKTAQGDAALHDVEMEALNIPPLERAAAVEKRAASEDGNTRELAAYCQAFVRRLVTVEEDGDVDRAIEDALADFGLGYVNDLIEYSDPASLLPLRDAIEKKLKGE